MMQAFIIVLREGFEAFLIVAITLAYLRKTNRPSLIPAVYWGIAASVLASVALAFGLNESIHTPLWEGIFGVVTCVMITALVIHMWRLAPQLKESMENKLAKVSEQPTTRGAVIGIFLFTVLMIAREGFETVILLFQLRGTSFVNGVYLGILATIALAYGWLRFSYLINLKRFFQVTSIFLLLFVVQIALYSFHEFTEVGYLHLGEELHEATEAFSPTGLYGRWFSMAIVICCAIWLMGAWVVDHFHSSRKKSFS